MTLLGRLLINRRADEAHAAWNRPNLNGSESLTVTSRQFDDGGSMPLVCCMKTVGGEDKSPHLAWTPPPAGTAELLLVMEDLDVPTPKPVVHCAALLDPAVGQLEPGALNGKHPGSGVRLLRSGIGRGYHGPGPIKGHGPHRYTFQLFALGNPVGGNAERERPRALLSAVTAPVLGRGRLTGVYER
ncbi:YbhB/YbcL family Raf kinase inhibitor-like protein [Kutzneria sp. CA-103260]|uniref:YbhB/YbcL family Raf kinase inhibitor-like protein n=1 Tax=Kutzneria sp. CA-103260 TaxID=2802641 RepID=UPI001BA4ED3E|nr:YbhB/YbcL family Raf kinase inhibitor-like protein [Kutzneria sp. CA-103260]QUQ62331.1 phosphatidylethanolamine-binding protein [Kutzneria sp. CA-103260]